MKQKHFLLLLFSLLFAFTNAQNNAMQISNDAYFSRYNTSSYFSYFGNSYFLNSTSFTIEYDFYLNSLNNYNARFSSFASNGVVAKPVHFYVNNTGTSSLFLGNGMTEEVVPGMPSFNVQQWYHIAIVVTNTITKNVKVYINGVPTIDYNFNATLDGFDGLTDMNLGATSYSSPTNTGNAKYDNFRIWSTARTATEIANNYGSCVAVNEPGLVSCFNFDGYNGSRIINLASNIPYYDGFRIFNNYSFVSGSGCTATILYSPITVSSTFNEVFYYAGQVNGKPHYKTEPWDCAANTTPASCAINHIIYSEIIWLDNQWILRPSNGCVWELGESCVPTTPINDNTLSINTADTAVPPCTGWSSPDYNFCVTLSKVNFELENEVLVYPNPSSGIFNISLQEDASVEIRDMLGKVIYTNKVKTGYNTIDISNYQSGIYLLNVKTENGSITKKIIRE